MQVLLSAYVCVKLSIVYDADLYHKYTHAYTQYTGAAISIC